MGNPVRRKNNARKHIGLRVKDTGKKMLASSPELRIFMKEKKGAFLQVHKIIRQHLEELKIGGAEFIDKEKKISIKKASTGSAGGRKHDVTLKVKVDKRAFFCENF